MGCSAAGRRVFSYRFSVNCSSRKPPHPASGHLLPRGGEGRLGSMDLMEGVLGCIMILESHTEG